jgi:co-chaperonin GroES (HSP10)
MEITHVLGNRVLVKVIPEAVADAPVDDIVVAPQSINPNYFKGEVVELGEEVGSAAHPSPLDAGDKVCFLKYGYEDMGDGLYIVEVPAILCIYTD